jgi:hypothetical protein
MRKITPTNTGLIIHLIPFINQHFSDILYDMEGAIVNPDIAGGKFICNKGKSESLDIIFWLEQPHILEIEHKIKHLQNGVLVSSSETTNQSFKVNQIDQMRSYLLSLAELKETTV